jgi:hypothetical protein
MNRLLKNIAFALAGLAVTGTACAAEGEWVSLFDGQTMSGWEKLPKDKSASHWEVQDGALTGSGEPSMLYSPKGDYKNFRFRAEIKINDHGNSGMYFRAKNTGSFTDGYEAQINSTHKDPIKTGSIYTMVHIYKQLVPPDTWFTQEVECVTKDYRGKKLPHIKVWVNGELLYELIDHTNFASSGYFAFQQHDPGSKVQIRKVEVMELPDGK